MLTREQRQQLEAEWSSDDRSMARFARLLKTAVLSVVVLSLLWMAGTVERQDNGQQVAAVGTSSPSGVQGGSAIRASRQTFDERRAQWQARRGMPVQQAASR